MPASSENRKLPLPQRRRGLELTSRAAWQALGSLCRPGVCWAGLSRVRPEGRSRLQGLGDRAGRLRLPPGVCSHGPWGPWLFHRLHIRTGRGKQRNGKLC